MDHNHIQKAIEDYNASMAEAVKAYENALIEYQTELFNALRSELGTQKPVPADEDVVVLSRSEREELLKKAQVVNDFIQKHPEAAL